MNDEYFDYIAEPADFYNKCIELVKMLKGSATAEVKAEMERLFEENERMRDVVDNYDREMAKIRAERQELAWQREKAACEVANMRLKKLFETAEAQMYMAVASFYTGAKCDRCDENRQISYVTPMGRKAKENCRCAEIYKKYEVHKSSLVEVSLAQDGEKIDCIYECDGDNICRIVPQYIVADGQDYESYNPVKTLFRSEEEAQKYVDWLNDREEKPVN